MGENEAISSTEGLPVTVSSLMGDLRALGVEAGSALIVHSSLKSLGWVCGGPVAVIQALERALGPGGTLVMPTHSGDLSDPAQWRNPPVPEPWWEIIRQTMPAYDPDLTPTRQMGAIPETFRKQRGVLRSAHPQVSFAAWGSHAQYVTEKHAIEVDLGEGSPLARVYELGGHVLLLGVGHGNNTSLHLSEYRADYKGKRQSRNGAPMMVSGRREWVWCEYLSINDDDFAVIGESFARETGLQRTGRVGNATALLFPQRAIVDYGVQWMERYRR